MSVRSLIELNHDYDIDADAVDELRSYRRSGSPGDLSHGFRHVGRYHHSDVAEHMPTALWSRLEAMLMNTAKPKRWELFDLLVDLAPLVQMLAKESIDLAPSVDVKP